MFRKQPLVKDEARGVVINYRIRYGEVNGKLQDLVEPCTEGINWIQLRNLSQSLEYHVTLNAETAAGYNESLSLTPAIIPSVVRSKLIYLLFLFSQPVSTEYFHKYLKLKNVALVYLYFFCTPFKLVKAGNSLMKNWL